MKLRSTTPVSFLRNMRWVAAVLIIGAIATYGIIQSTQPASADQYQRRINALQAEMSKYEKEAQRLNGEAITLKNTLAQLDNQKRSLQAQIDLSQAQHDKLVIQIAETEQEIKDNQDALGVTIADLYVGDTISPIEMLASSKNINEFLDKQEYRNSIRDELGSTIKRVRTLKAELTEKKEEVTEVLKDQKVARSELVARENDQKVLLQQTQNDEAAYQKMIKDNKEEIVRVRAQQAAMNARANQNGGYTLVDVGLLSSYKWNDSNCPMGGVIPGYGYAAWASTRGANGNGGDGYGPDGASWYGCRQCASYVAWKVAQVTGGKYYNWGNGGDFGRNAVAAGYRNLGRNPQAGSIAVMWGNPGHVAWVEAVDGDYVTVSQYNWEINGRYGMYSLMTLHKNTFDQYVKIT